MISRKKGTYQFMIIMILVTFLVASISILIVYRVVIQDKKDFLQELSENQTGIIESIYAKEHDPEEVLQLLRQQRKHNAALGKTGEFVIGYLKNDTIFFLLEHLRYDFAHPIPVPFKSKRAEPMKFALLRKTGIMRGIDYSNDKVLAYCSYIPGLKWGIVAKINISEVYEPFYRTGLYAGLISVLFVTIATLIFRRISDPISDKMIENEEMMRAILDATQESIYLFDRQGRFQMANRIGQNRLNLTEIEILDHHFSEFMTPELASARQEHLDHVITSGQPERFEDIRNGIYFEHHFYPCFKDDQVSYVATYSRDVTEMRIKEKQLLKLNRILKALEKSSKTMLKAVDEAFYINEVCRIVVDDCDFAMVWIGFALDNEAKTVEPIAYAGFEKGYLEQLHITWADNERGQGPTGRAIRTGKPAICRNMDTDPAFAPWREEALKRGYASSLVIPLLDKGVAFGAINIYSSEPDSFSDQEINFLSELAADLASGISALRLKLAQEKAEKELRQSELRFRTLAENIPDLIMRFDPNLRVIYANPAVLRRTGLPAGTLIGRTTREYGASSASSEIWEKAALEVMQSGEMKRYEHTSDWQGEMRIFDAQMVPECDPDGQVEAVIVIAHDITKRKKAEEALKESEEKLKLALENGSIGVWVWDIPTNAIEWDERMERIFGMESGSFGKTYGAFEACLIDEDIPHVRKAIKKALEEDIPFETVYRIKMNRGDVKYISAKALVKKDDTGTPVRMTGVCYDVTAMKKDTEESLFSLNEELLRSNKELEQFAYVASHDLQEPLRMVSSFTQLLAQRYNDRLDNDAKEFIQYAVNGATQMQALINDLLAYSRIQTKGKEFSNVDMHEALGKAVHNLGTKIQEKNVLITNGELPMLYVDEGQMVQLFQNLIGNAIKFSLNSPIIHISSSEENDQYILSVKDNGIGIEKQYFDRIFQIFQKLHPKDEYEGTGIGLAVCKRIVERHGGKIWIESEKGKGSTFYFSLNKNKRS
jgi:two-component system, chemotaxis family, sensor kinase Cph1